MRLAEALRSGWVLGCAALAVGATLMVHTATAARPTPFTVDLPPEVPALGVHDTVGDRCIVTRPGSPIHLTEDPDTCANVIRVYKVEGDHLIFDHEEPIPDGPLASVDE